MIVNLDAVEKAMKGERVELWTSPKTRVTYEPAKVGVVVRENGKIVAVIDRKGFARYWKTNPRAIATQNWQTFWQILHHAISSELGEFTVTLDENSYRIRGEFEPEHYPALIKVLKSPLVAAYLVGRTVSYAVTPPAAIEHLEEPAQLVKLAAVAEITGYRVFRYADAAKLAAAPAEEITRALERAIKLPFGSKVPVVYRKNGTEFYSDGMLYCLVRGKRVESNACTNWKDFCETVEVKFAQILSKEVVA